MQGLRGVPGPPGTDGTNGVPVSLGGGVDGGARTVSFPDCALITSGMERGTTSQ